MKHMVESQNNTTYSHWSKHHDYKRRWMATISQVMHAWRNVVLTYSEWSLERHYAPPHRQMDFANLVGGAKPLIDSLTDCGVIKDDNPDCFLCDYKQVADVHSYTRLILKNFSR